jgi:hypothetical protein
MKAYQEIGPVEAGTHGKLDESETPMAAELHKLLD